MRHAAVSGARLKRAPVPTIVKIVPSVPALMSQLPSNRSVVVLAYDGLATFEFGIAVEVFGLPRPELGELYRLSVAAVEPGPLRGPGGVRVAAAWAPRGYRGDGMGPRGFRRRGGSSFPTSASSSTPVIPDKRAVGARRSGIHARGARQ